jgi:HD superfamily phosphohydrolase
MNNTKIIRDSIHGNIKLNEFFIKLLNSPELQRLYNIKQLGFAHLVFPGAHHSRLEHSLGTYYIASEISKSINLNDEERNIIKCAALLHDVGHGPFSHTLEIILQNSLNLNHVELTKRIIFGKYDILQSEEKNFTLYPQLSEILDKENIDKNLLSNIITGNNQNKSYMVEILNSTIDADQLDYLIRDAYYTGVAYGIIDLQRFIQTIVIFNDKLAIQKKGIGVIENILMARNLMYSSVYFHKTVRIAELMLLKSIEMMPDLNPFDFFKKTDIEILNYLKDKGSFQNKIITCLKYRNLFKQSYSISYLNLDEIQKKIINTFKNIELKREKEREIEYKLNIPKGHIIIDTPIYEIDKTEPRLNRTDVTILDKNQQKKLDDFTPVAKAIRSKNIPDWALMIITEEKYREIVTKKVEKILFN